MATPPRRGTLAFVLLAMAALFVATGLLTGAYRAERQQRAEGHFRAGRKLAEEGKNAQAAAEYRSALSYRHHDPRYRLALALALDQMHNWAEAQARLMELRNTDPSHGLTNLMLARLAASQDRIDDAVMYYRSAIYGLWEERPRENRIEARFELIDLFLKTGNRKQSLAQLLELAAEAPAEGAVKRRIGGQLIQAGAPREAADVYREVLKSDQRDAEAYQGLAEAESAMGDYRGARRALQHAVLLQPASREVEQRLEQIEDIIRLDIDAPHISSSLRYRRSQALLRTTLESLERCLAESGKSVDAATKAEANKLMRGRGPRNRDDAIADNIAMAQRVWTVRRKFCGPPPANDPLVVVFSRLPE